MSTNEKTFFNSTSTKIFPNRAQRRKDCGINKRGLHQPGRKGKMLLVDKNAKYRHFIQRIPIFHPTLFKVIIGYRKITHTQPL